MKELSIEGKATRYDKVVNKLRRFMEQGIDPLITRADVQDFFPELMELEDERIRKELIAMVKLSCTNGDDVDKKIAWLEKQAGQKPTIFIPKFRVGDKLVSTKNPRLTYEVLEVGHINELGNPEYKVEIFTDGKVSNPRNIHDMECYKVDEWAKLIEQNPVDKAELKSNVGDWVVCESAPRYTAFNIGDVVQISSKETLKIFLMFKDCFRPWTIQDAKDGDVLCYKDEISLYKHDIKNCAKQETTFGGFVYHCCYDGKRFITDSLYSLTEQDKMDIHPATKEQRDTLEKAMADAGYTFDFDKKELKKISDFFKAEYERGKTDAQKSSWSEEDEVMFRTAKKIIFESDDCSDGTSNKVIDWLKSLKERVQPKQEWSEEDETRLTNTIIMLKEGASLHFIKKDITKAVDWLKSLKDRHTYKPSKEQMKALYDSMPENVFEISEREQLLESLYQDLKKL